MSEDLDPGIAPPCGHGHGSWNSRCQLPPSSSSRPLFLAGHHDISVSADLDRPVTFVSALHAPTEIKRKEGGAGDLCAGTRVGRGAARGVCYTSTGYRRAKVLQPMAGMMSLRGTMGDPWARKGGAVGGLLDTRLSWSKPGLFASGDGLLSTWPSYHALAGVRDSVLVCSASWAYGRGAQVHAKPCTEGNKSPACFSYRPVYDLILVLLSNTASLQ